MPHISKADKKNENAFTLTLTICQCNPKSEINETACIDLGQKPHSFRRKHSFNLGDALGSAFQKACIAI